MDGPTQSYYRRHAKELTSRYAKASTSLVDWFIPVLRPRARILDVGCGTGRDLGALLGGGFDAYGCDPSPEMIAEAESTIVKMDYSTQGRLFETGLPDLVPFDSSEFDALLCNAVLM